MAVLKMPVEVIRHIASKLGNKHDILNLRHALVDHNKHFPFVVDRQIRDSVPLDKTNIFKDVSHMFQGLEVIFWNFEKWMDTATFRVKANVNAVHVRSELVKLWGSSFEVGVWKIGENVMIDVPRWSKMQGQLTIKPRNTYMLPLNRS